MTNSKSGMSSPQLILTRLCRFLNLDVYKAKILLSCKECAFLFYSDDEGSTFFINLPPIQQITFINIEEEYILIVSL